MAWFRKMRLKIAEHFIRKVHVDTKRVKKVFNFSDAKSIGFLFNADHRDDYQRVKRYIQKLTEEESFSKVMALGYVNQKKYPEKIHPKQGFDYFCKKDLKWTGRGTSLAYKHFVEEQYDILIDLSHHASTPLKFALAESRAHFKVGKMRADYEDYYDFMISVKEEKYNDNLLEEVSHYLKHINKPVQLSKHG